MSCYTKSLVRYAITWVCMSVRVETHGLPAGSYRSSATNDQSSHSHSYGLGLLISNTKCNSDAAFCEEGGRTEDVKLVIKRAASPMQVYLPRGLTAKGGWHSL